MMRTYTVSVTRDDDLWVAIINGLPPGTVGAGDYERFADLHDDVPELIADLTDTDPAEIAIAWRYEFNGHDVTDQIQHLLALSDQLRSTQREREQARAEALATLADAGLSQRVMADVVQLSHQRVNQLLHVESKVA